MISITALTLAGVRVVGEAYLLAVRYNVPGYGNERGCDLDSGGGCYLNGAVCLDPFRNMSRTVGSSWATHSRIGLKDQVEFLRPNLQKLNFEIALDFNYGVDPRAIIELSQWSRLP